MQGTRLERKNREWMIPLLKNGGIGRYMSKSDMLTLLQVEIRQGQQELEKTRQEAYGTCEECEELSENLKWLDNRWVCEMCTEELGIIK